MTFTDKHLIDLYNHSSLDEDQMFIYDLYKESKSHRKSNNTYDEQLKQLNNDLDHYMSKK